MFSRCLMLLGGGVALALLSQLAAEPVGAEAPRSLAVHTLWQIHGGDPFLCCAAMEHCMLTADCSDMNDSVLTNPVFCTAYSDIEQLSGNAQGCDQSPFPDDHCSNSVGYHVCAKWQSCKVIVDQMTGMPLCVNDSSQPWIDKHAPDACTGPACT